MYKVIPTSRFKKDLKAVKKRGYNLSLLEAVVEKLKNGETLPAANRDHDLHGNFEGFRECHITPDWLLVYAKKDDVLVLSLSRTGTHSDLF